MEADIELAALILGLMFAIVVLVRGLSAIASMIDVLKFARGPFVFRAHAARGARRRTARGQSDCQVRSVLSTGGEGQLA